MDESGRDNLREPIKPPRRWRKRLVKTAVVLAVCILVLAILWWYGVAKWDSRLQAQLDEYRAAGQPVYLADFQQPPPVADENNAALAFTKAADSIDITLDQVDELTIYADPEAISQHLDEFAKEVLANAEVFALVRSARSMTGADWGIPKHTNPIYLQWPNYGQQRNLARVLCATAVYHHLIGDDVEAIGVIQDTLSLAQTQREYTYLLSHLVGIAIESLAYKTIEEIAPDFKESDPAKEAAKALMAEMLDEEDIYSAVRRALLHERALFLETSEGWMKGELGVFADDVPSAGEAIFAKTFKLFHKRDLVQRLQIYTAGIEACVQPSWPEAKELLLPMPEYKTIVAKFMHVLSEILAMPQDNLLKLQYRSLADRRMAAVSLAMRLYELDHGLRPVKLADLVPDYLPFVPKDPFAADGRQISYALDAAKPVLYSIGPNGIDDGGDPNSMDDSNDSSQWGGLDIVFYLNGDRPENYSAKLQPASPSTTQPASAPGDDGSTEK